MGPTGEAKGEMVKFQNSILSTIFFKKLFNFLTKML